MKYQRYIAKGLTVTTLMVALSLTAIVWLMQALRLVDFIVNQGVSITIFLRLSVLLLPSVLMLVLPPALLCAVVFFYHRLKVDSELPALQAIGLSRLQLAAPALAVACAVTVMGYLLSLYVTPLSYREFRSMQFFLRNNYVSVLLQEGVFATPTHGLMVYIRERESSGTLRGILVHDTRDPSAAVTLMADAATVVETRAGPQFMLMHGSRQEMRGGALSYLTFESTPLDLSGHAGGHAGRREDEREYALGELFARAHDAARSPAARGSSMAEAHQRLLWPAYALTLAAVGLAVLFTGEFNRRQRFKRNVMTIVLASALIFLSVSLRSSMALNAALVPVAYACLLLPFAVALAILVQPRRRAMKG